MKPKANPKIEQEPELVARAKTGDREAFAALYNEYAPMVLRFLRGRMPNHATAEDLTSETFLRAFRRVDSFAWTGHDFGAWLHTIARNISHDYYKSSYFRREYAVEEMRDHDTAEESTEHLVLDTLDDVSRRDAVEAALANLTPGQANCLRLRYIHEMSIDQAAAALGLSRGAVKTLTYRATRSMQRQLVSTGTAAAA